MSHYRLNDDEPSAIVTVNGSEKKIYDKNQIFLNPDDNFEFRFFNPLQEKIGVEIIFNGINKGNSLLILNPGEDVSLDRFMDDKKKMKYSTYFINEQNEKAVKATEKNGLVEIKFYKEKFFNVSYGGYSNTTGLYNSSGNWNLDQTYTTSTSSIDLGNSQNIFRCSVEEPKLKSLETGRVEKGETSKQDFKQVSGNFETISFHTIRYELKPQSTIISKIRNYCPSCGLRLKKKSWSYCPSCGEEI